MTVEINRFATAEYRTEINTHYYKFEYRNNTIFIGNFDTNLKVKQEDIDSLIEQLTYFRDSLVVEGII